MSLETISLEKKEKRRIFCANAANYMQISMKNKNENKHKNKEFQSSTCTRTQD